MSEPTDNAAMTLPLSDLRSKITTLLAKATPGPWHVDVDSRDDGADQVCYADGARSLTLAFMSVGRAATDGEFPDPDAELICLLRNHADLFLSLLGGAAPLQTCQTCKFFDPNEDDGYDCRMGVEFPKTSLVPYPWPEHFGCTLHQPVASPPEAK